MDELNDSPMTTPSLMASVTPKQQLLCAKKWVGAPTWLAAALKMGTYLLRSPNSK